MDDIEHKVWSSSLNIFHFFLRLDCAITACLVAYYTIDRPELWPNRIRLFALLHKFYIVECPRVFHISFLVGASEARILK